MIIWLLLLFAVWCQCGCINNNTTGLTAVVTTTTERTTQVVSTQSIATSMTTVNTSGVVCPKVCSCDQANLMVKCVDQNLTAIPMIPHWTKILEFTGNNLTQVQKETFMSISTLRITGLNISNNKIKIMNSTAFVGFKDLESLDVSYNPIINGFIPAFYNSNLNVTLRRLVLNWVGLDDSPKHAEYEFLRRIGKTDITYLDLTRNTFYHLSDYHFSKTTHLLLDFSYFQYGDNIKNYVSLCGIGPNMEYISLKSSTLQGFDIQPRTKCPLIPVKTLDLRNNSLAEPGTPNSLSHLRQLETLYLDKNNLRVIPSNFISELHHLHTLSMTNQNATNVTFLPYAFNSSSLLHLNISTRSSNFYVSVDIRNMFRLTPNLQTLSMRTINLSSSNPDDLTVLFYPLQHLIDLDIADTFLSHLPSDTFNRLTKLRSLRLSHNYLEHIDTNVLQNINTLEYLYLDNNRIHTVTEHSFPPKMLQSIQAFDLHSNPFSCTCEMTWFKDWLKRAVVSHKLGNSTLSDYKCQSSIPEAFQGYSIDRYSPSITDCYLPYIIGPSSGLFVIVILISCCIVAYRKRWRIRYLRFLMKNTTGFERLPECNSLECDVFVISDYTDKDWVCTNLLPQVLNTKIRKVYIYAREYREKTILPLHEQQCMSQSNKTCIAISNTFMKHHGCVLDMVVSQLKSIHSDIKENRVLIVFMEEILQENKSDTLTYLLNYLPSFQFDTNLINEDQFWGNILAAFKE